MSKEISNIINFPQEKPLIIGNNALKAEYWENPRPISAQVIDFEKYTRNPLIDQIEYLDTHWQEEELPKDWWKVDDIGFSSKRQMRLLDEVEDVGVWSEQTGRDLLGFGLEYLRQGTVFPFEYKIEDGSLVDPKYGNRKMTETVDPKERGGAVLQSLERIQEHLLEKGEGATAVMVSPPGHTGLTMDDGSRIVYTDTMIIHMQTKGDRVIGTTFRVDMNLPKAKQLIERLTGQVLPDDATPTDCTRAITLLDGNDSLSASSLLDAAQDVQGSRYSYKDRTFNETRLDLQRREELYFFDQITEVKINDFIEYANTGFKTKEQLQKALAATFLGISNHLLIEKPQIQKERNPRVLSIDNYIPKRITMGALISKVKALPGCMGGGRVTSVESIINVPGQVEENWDNKITRKYDKAGPCKQCGAQVGCGPCGICKTCNDSFDSAEASA